MATTDYMAAMIQSNVFVLGENVLKFDLGGVKWRRKQDNLKNRYQLGGFQTGRMGEIATANRTVSVTSNNKRIFIICNYR
jgi:hypothetical protein